MILIILFLCIYVGEFVLVIKFFFWVLKVVIELFLGFNEGIWMIEIGGRGGGW